MSSGIPASKQRDSKTSMEIWLVVRRALFRKRRFRLRSEKLMDFACCACSQSLDDCECLSVRNRPDRVLAVFLGKWSSHGGKWFAGDDRNIKYFFNTCLEFKLTE